MDIRQIACDYIEWKPTLIAYENDIISNSD